MGQTSIELTRTYASIAGVDITAIIQGEKFAEAQAISYAVQREKAPVYTLGSVDPRAFSRGKRGIAGTIVSLLFDKHVIFSRNFDSLKFIADKDEVYAEVNDLNDATNLADLNLVGGGDVLNPVFDESDISSNFQLNRAWYFDQLPSFDIVLVGVTEAGKAAQMRIYGVEVLNEGAGFSVDDMQIDSQATYVARTILPWQPMGEFDMTTGAFSPVSST